MTEDPKKINKKDRLLPTVGQAVNSRSSAFTIHNFNTKGAIYGTN